MSVFHLSSFSYIYIYKTNGLLPLSGLHFSVSRPLQNNYSLQPGPQIKANLQRQRHTKRKNQAAYQLLCSLRIKRSFVKKEMDKVLKIGRKNTLPNKEKCEENRIPLAVTCHLNLPPVGRIINKHWPMLHHKDRTKKIFKNRPIVSRKRPRNLRDILVKATFSCK